MHDAPQVPDSVAADKSRKAAAERNKVVRPAVWADVELKLVPRQPDEEDYGDEQEDNTGALNRPVADPLGLVKVDLREIQTMQLGGLSRAYSSQGKDPSKRSSSVAQPAANTAKRSSTMHTGDFLGIMRRIEGAIKIPGTKKASSSSAQEASSRSAGESEARRSVVSSSGGKGTWGRGGGDEAFDEYGSSEEAGPASILPSDRNFSPSLFLSLVHAKAGIPELKTGLDNLQVILDQQSNMRENLVRTHLGLFIDCVDSIHWLKQYQFESPTEQRFKESLGTRKQDKRRKDESSSASGAGDSSSSTHLGRVDGEQMASYAVLNLAKVKTRSQLLISLIYTST
jgi:hypothetical protein